MARNDYHTRLPQDYAEALDELVEDKKISIAEALRRAVAHYLAAEGYLGRPQSNRGMIAASAIMMALLMGGSAHLYIWLLKSIPTILFSVLFVIGFALGLYILGIKINDHVYTLQTQTAGGNQ